MDVDRIIIGSRIDVALQLLPEKGNKLLDVGCGSGKLCKCVAPNYKNVCGVDKICEAREKLAEIKNVGIHYANLDDLDGLPFLDNTFNVVTCLDVLEHVHNPNFVVSEMYRVLTNEGIIIVSVPNIRYWLHLLTLAFKGKFPVTSDDAHEWDGGHIHYFTFKDVCSLLESNGFSIVEERGVFGHDSHLKTVTSPGVVVKARK